MNGETTSRACSFCGKPAEQVQRMFPGSHAQICDGCVSSCNEVLHDELGIEPPPPVAANDGRETVATQPNELSRAALSALPAALAAHLRFGRAAPLSLFSDLLGLTGGESVGSDTARLAEHESMQQLVELEWPVKARVAFVLLLTSEVDDPDFAPPPEANPTQIAWELIRILDDSVTTAPPPIETLLAPVKQALDDIDERLLTLLRALGPHTCAEDPTLPLMFRHRLDEILPVWAPNVHRLDIRLPRHTEGTREGAGPVPMGGLAPQGTLTALMPSQWALPERLLTWRLKSGGLLYRARAGAEPPCFRPTIILLDVSPATLPVEHMLRPVAHAVISALLRAGVPAYLMAAGGANRIFPLQQPADLFSVLTAQTPEPVDVDLTLRQAQALRSSLVTDASTNPIILLLSHPCFGRDHLHHPTIPHLRGLFARYPRQKSDPFWASRCDAWGTLAFDDLDAVSSTLAELLH